MKGVAESSIFGMYDLGITIYDLGFLVLNAQIAYWPEINRKLSIK